MDLRLHWQYLEKSLLIATLQNTVGGQNGSGRSTTIPDRATESNANDGRQGNVETTHSMIYHSVSTF